MGFGSLVCMHEYIGQFSNICVLLYHSCVAYFPSLACLVFTHWRAGKGLARVDADLRGPRNRNLKNNKTKCLQVEPKHEYS